MKNITVKDIIRICDAKLICGNEYTECENFEKDSRLIKSGDVFVGIKGENFDGNLMYEDAIKNGATLCIVSGIIPQKHEGNTVIKVKDSVTALQQIAEYKRSLYNIPVIAVTGSVGKTSTKDIVASVMSEKYKTLKTQGNLNNHIGLPLTVLKLKDHEALVVEMGMNHFGEIRTLTNIVHPTISIINNIGTSHIGNLGSRENILKAKLEILEGTENTSPVIINNDNDLLSKWAKGNNTAHKIITYGIDNKSDVTATNIKYYEDRSIYNVKIIDKEYNIIVPVGGKHFIYNSLAAICAGIESNIEIEKIAEGIKKFKLTKRRMEIIESVQNGATIVNDTYNASYESVKAALEYLREVKSDRKIAILGDMLELGEYSKEMHEKVGIEVARNNIDILITVGRESKNIVNKVEELNTTTKTYQCKSIDDAIEIAKKELKKGDLVLVKASNGMHFDKIVEGIV